MGDSGGESTKPEDLSINLRRIFRCTTGHSTQGNPIPTGQTVGVAANRTPPPAASSAGNRNSFAQPHWAVATHKIFSVNWLIMSGGNRKWMQKGTKMLSDIGFSIVNILRNVIILSLNTTLFYKTNPDTCFGKWRLPSWRWSQKYRVFNLKLYR